MLVGIGDVGFLARFFCGACCEQKSLPIQVRAVVNLVASRKWQNPRPIAKLMRAELLNALAGESS